MKGRLLLLFLSLGSFACASVPSAEPVPIHVRLVAGPSELAHPSQRTGRLLELDRVEIERRLRRSLARRPDLVLAGPKDADYELMLTLDTVFGPELIETSALISGARDYWVRVKVGTLIVRRGTGPGSVQGVQWIEAEQKLVFETHGPANTRRESRVFERAVDQAASRTFDDFLARTQRK
ncbi:MAG: hypothetical protein AAGD10_02955 [Myxococcota bacterium]